ncbi:hypothetical protein [Aquimonas sp.]|jgi:hypothetical protein|uniref:hypothetical protein n=1 Tax=Aquimonas sp. TaxID=1872588 RepID=UPI0037C1A96F
MNHLLTAVACATLALPLFAQAQVEFIAVQPGTPVSMTINPSSVVSSYSIDVPAGPRGMRLELRASDLSKDVDLLLRYGSPFELRNQGGARVDIQQLFDQAQYRSTGGGGDEFLLIHEGNAIPLRAGRWHLAIVNFEDTPISATLSASLTATTQAAAIEVVFDHAGTASRPCDVSGWNAAEARSPIRGNTGTTLGQQRRLAAQEAARLLTTQLQPRVPVRIQACWSDLGSATGNSFTLAQAGPEYLFLNDIGQPGYYMPSIERPFTWYSAAATAQQIGTTVCRLDGGFNCANTFDVRATFNSSLDQAGAASFDYGFTTAGAATSFVSVAMHEITHGLGFFGLITVEPDDGAPVGSKRRVLPNGPLYDDIYGSHVVSRSNDGSTLSPFLRITDAERAQALVSEPQLRFTGSNALSAAPQLIPAPEGYIRLHAPLTLTPGSTYSHISSFNYGVQLMTAQLNASGPRELGIAGGVLRDVGWNSNRMPQRSFELPDSFQYFDPTRNGHGIDFRLISPSISGLPAEYFLGFYTYDANGDPEWYIATGPVIDGVFLPKNNPFGDSLLRQRYLGPDQSESDSSARYAGRIRIDFNDARRHPACSDGAPGRNLDGPLGVMTTTINGQRLQWCMQPVVVPTRVSNDYSSIWYSPGDGGWGLALQSFNGAGSSDGLFSVLFYADATGEPRWALGQINAFTPGVPQPLWQVRGYCRSCPSPATQQLSAPIGSLTLNLVRGGAGASGNRVSIDVTYPGTQGGRFTRSSVNLLPNSDPTLGDD